MKLEKYIVVLFIAFVMFIPRIASSQENTMYFMYNTQQNHFYNPAMTGNCKFYFGLPGISAFQLGYENRGFHLMNMLNQPDNMRDLLDDINSFDFDLKFDILSFGYRLHKLYLTFDLSNKTNYHLAIPRDFFIFAWEGNANYIGQSLDFNNFNFGFTNYFEAAFGGSYQLFDNLKIGGKFKLMSGIANLNTQKWEMELYTEPGTYIIDAHSDIMLNASFPFPFSFEDSGIPTFFGSSDTVSVFNYLIHNYTSYNHNFGYGIDLGFVYDFNDRLSLSASAVDLFSRINWKSGVVNFSESLDAHIEGLDLNSLIGNDINNTDLLSNMLDSLSGEFEYSSTANPYHSIIPPSFYFGARYEFFNWLNAGFLIHDKYYNNHNYFSYTLSGNAKLIKILSTSLTYTINGSGNSNLGVGLGIKLLYFQMYLVADNVLGIKYDPNYALPWPSGQNMDFRIAINFLIGCRNKSDKK